MVAVSVWAYALLGALAGLFVGGLAASLIIGGLLGVGATATWPLAVGGVIGGFICSFLAIQLWGRLGSPDRSTAAPRD